MDDSLHTEVKGRGVDDSLYKEVKGDRVDSLYTEVKGRGGDVFFMGRLRCLTSSASFPLLSRQ